MISVIIPTRDRPTMLLRAVRSVLNQTHTDLEVIIVDDGAQPSASATLAEIHDSRVRVILPGEHRGAGAARNAGIRAATGDLIAFLDDDDEWVPEKLALQVSALAGTDPGVGFCFSAVRNEYQDRAEITHVPTGIREYTRLGLAWFKGFLTVTLVLKREVFDVVGVFDESFPSHQESDLMIRVTRRYRGIGIDQPLVRVSMKDGYERIGSSMERRLKGREMIVQKYLGELQKYPQTLAQHYDELGFMERTRQGWTAACRWFWLGFRTRPSVLRLWYIVSMWGGGLLYRFQQQLKNHV